MDVTKFLKWGDEIELSSHIILSYWEVWDLVSCDISCIHSVLGVWIQLNLAVKFRNYLIILTQPPAFSDTSLLSSPFPDSYRTQCCVLLTFITNVSNAY